jgi:hypothetical protein
MTSQARLLEWSDKDRAALRAFVVQLRGDVRNAAPDRDVIEGLPEPTEPTELDRARAVLRQRQARARVFSDVQALFHDGAWDIMLHLFIAQEEGRPMTVRQLEGEANLPVLSFKRWLSVMVNANVIARWEAQAGENEELITLTPRATEMMLRFLDEV